MAKVSIVIIKDILSVKGSIYIDNRTKTKIIRSIKKVFATEVEERVVENRGLLIDKEKGYVGRTGILVVIVDFV